MAKKKSQMVGRWRITSMTEWDQDFVDEDVPGYFEFRKDGLGDFQFGYVQGQIDWRDAEITTWCRGLSGSGSVGKILS